MYGRFIAQFWLTTRAGRAPFTVLAFSDGHLLPLTPIGGGGAQLQVVDPTTLTGLETPRQYEVEKRKQLLACAP